MGFAGGSGSKPNTFPSQITCYKCGKSRHISSNCPDKGMNNQTGHLKATGRVFTLDGVEALKSKDLIQGKCFIKGIPLLVLFECNLFFYILFVCRET